MRFLLWSASRLLYVASVLLFLAAASPTVEAWGGFRYEILDRIPHGIWWVFMLAGVVTVTCGATLHCLARICDEVATVKRIVAR